MQSRSFDAVTSLSHPLTDLWTFNHRPRWWISNRILSSLQHRNSALSCTILPNNYWKSPGKYFAFYMKKVHFYTRVPLELVCGFCNIPQSYTCMWTRFVRRDLQDVRQKWNSTPTRNKAQSKNFQWGANWCWWMVQNSQLQPHYEGVLCQTQ